MSRPENYSTSRKLSVKLKPGVAKHWLIILAGVMWSSVGVYLVLLGADWIALIPGRNATLIVLAGVLLGAAIYSFGFSKFAKRNIRRIVAIASEAPCLFAFQEWTSYPLVVVMISLGIFLRVYLPIPKRYLAIVYLGIGISLFLASLHYYNHLWISKIKKAGIRTHS